MNIKKILKEVDCVLLVIYFVILGLLGLGFLDKWVLHREQCVPKVKEKLNNMNKK